LAHEPRRSWHWSNFNGAEVACHRRKGLKEQAPNAKETVAARAWLQQQPDLWSWIT